MNREEAKAILSAYRPGGQDAGDAHFRAALALAQSDAELGAWFAEQQRFDAEVSREMKFLRAPLALKANILAQQKPAEPPFTLWWAQRQFYAVFAGAALLAVVVLVLFLRPSGPRLAFADFERQMLTAATDREHHVEIHDLTLNQTQAWLSQHKGEANFTLPVTLRTAKGLMGCRTLAWQGKKISMLCFMLDGSQHTDLFVAARKDFTDAPAEKPLFGKLGQLNTVAWSEGTKVYLMMGEADASLLKKYLSSNQRPENGFSPLFATVFTIHPPGQN